MGRGPGEGRRLCPAPGTLEQERARKGGHRGRGAEQFCVGEHLSRWAELKVRGDRGQVGWDGGMQVRLQRDFNNIGSGAGGLGQERREDGQNVYLWERPNLRCSLTPAVKWKRCLVRM